MKYASFESLKLPVSLCNALIDLKFSEPTPIQRKAIPLIRGGYDLLAIAQTGTGKTAAFVLPALMKIKYAQGNLPRVLILSPTRELVIQTTDHIRSLAKYTNIRYMAMYGGIGHKYQSQILRDGIDILTGTPGQIKKIYFQGDLLLKKITLMILDEADKIMDMGFMPQIRSLLELVPTKRQNLLFSATMSPKVIELSKEFLAFPKKVEVTPQATPARNISQTLFPVPNFRTKKALLAFLLKKKEDFSRVLVFVRTRQRAEEIKIFLKRKVDSSTQSIHSNKNQNARISAVNKFKIGKWRILVATDIAARGIDIDQITHVINFDIPLRYEDYVHRIGRTGRAFHFGKAITFYNPAEAYHLKKIEALIRMKIPVYPLPEEVQIFETDFQEKQSMLREIDIQKRIENPEFKGAFHEKKRKKYGTLKRKTQL